MQWLQDPNQSDVDNLNNVRREVNKHSRNRKKEYLRAKIDELVNKVRSRISEICIGVSEKLRMVNSLELYSKEWEV
jgi:ElaB/YqjD/DUF883 family membrane-anchored ribosome-binding protein